MPLLLPSELTVAALMADLPMQRSAANQIRMQLLTLKEGLELPINPLLRTTQITRHLVQAGETLPIISTRIWGKPDYWQQLANANGIEYPFVVVPGQSLEVPDVGLET